MFRPAALQPGVLIATGWYAVGMSRGKRLVVGNWKMYVENLESARSLTVALRRNVGSLQGVEVWIAPPMPFIPLLSSRSSSILVGAQHASAYTEDASAPFSAGAHTGEVTAAVLREAGAQFAIVGHSERRALGESDAAVNAELRSVIGNGLRAILCVGEHERDEHGNHFEILAGQLRSALDGIQGSVGSKLTVAYEPVWAIGKSAEDAAKPEIVRETVIFIRKMLTEIAGREAALRIPILYGGSVVGTNAAALIEHADISGFLVGRASTETEAFLEIIQACANPKREIQNHKQIPNTKSKKSKRTAKRRPRTKKRK
jgi:triosephosphate isomerase (TIM)